MMDTKWDEFLARATLFMNRVEASLPQAIRLPNWEESIAFRYQRQRTGHGALLPVRHVGVMNFSSLREIDLQKEKIFSNTDQFVKGLPANNVLLTGARGTGKSSLVRACLHAFAREGLRLIEVDKADLLDLPELVDAVANRPEKFLLFCDDLSFDEGEAGYKALKSILDGSVAAATPNVLVYATSNRRHLLPEYHAENLAHTRSADGELHPGEAVEEKVSLSERFGLWISFYPFSQDQYLQIVDQWLGHYGVDGALKAAAHPSALVWALERGSRSGRVAYQFARDYVGRHGNA